MQALRFEKTGAIAHLQWVECPTPSSAAGEVLIRVHAGGLNRSDTSNVMGHFPYTTLPRTPGRDFAGVVERGPPALLGQAVWGSGKEIGFTRDGSHAEYLSLPATGVALKPTNLSFVEAASCGVPYVTAWFGLEMSRVAAVSRVVIVGAAGGVGIAAMQLARLRGAKTLGLVRRAEQAAHLSARGFAAEVIAEPASFRDGIHRHFSDGADFIYDTAGHWLAQSVGALAKFGRVAVIVVPPADGHERVPLRDLYRRGGSIVGVNSLLYSAEESAAMFAAITPHFESGALRPPDGLVARPLSEGTQVYEDLRKGAAGKFVLVTS